MASPLAVDAITRTVSSPAIVPIAPDNCEEPIAESNELATNWAAAGGVFITTVFPLAITESNNPCEVEAGEFVGST